MPKGPPVHELFNQPMVGKKESKPTTVATKKTIAPLPPMKKFGGYKPKILGGGSDDLIPVSTDNRYKTEPAPQEAPRRPVPVITKPKPFIIGDKDTPMILSTADDDSDDDRDIVQSRMEDMHIYEEPSFLQNGDRHEVNNNDMNNNSENLYSKRIVPDEMVNHNNEINVYHGHQSPSVHGEFSAPDDLDTLLDASHTQSDPTTFATDNPVFQNGEIEENHITTLDIKTNDRLVEPETEPEGVFIPTPDYEEDEKTMEFAGEDPDDILEERQQQQQQQQQQHNMHYIKRHQQQQRQHPDVGLKMYDGEDFSKYLSDDDDDEAMFIHNVNNMKPANNIRLQQKHSLFKIKANNTTGNRKASSKNKAPAFNSVRSFSYADSKYGTNGKSGGKKMAFTEFSGDHESFLKTSQQGEGYETFLRSKHGVNSDATNREDTDFPQWNGKSRDGNIWKKLTVRLRHKMQGGGRVNLA